MCLCRCVSIEWFTNKEAVPGHIFVLAGIAFWCYMTCDNCDGMQSRRLKLSSPIGEMMDHGVDSFVVCMAPLIQVLIYYDNKGWWAPVLLLAFQYFFYCTHLMHVLSGQLLLGYKYFSVDELFIIFGGVLCVEGYTHAFSEYSFVYNGVTLYAGQLLLGVMIMIPGTMVTVQVIGLFFTNKSSFSDFLSLFVLPISICGLAIYLFPLDMWCWFTFVPMYSLIIWSTACMSMGDEPVAWHRPFLLVIAIKFFLFNTAALAPLAAACSGLLFFVHLIQVVTRMQVHCLFSSRFRNSLFLFMFLLVAPFVVCSCPILFLFFFCLLIVRSVCCVFLQEDYQIPTLFTVPVENRPNYKAIETKKKQ